VPIHFGVHTLGETAGTTSVTITQSQMPAHNHFLMATNTNGALKSPTNNFMGAVSGVYGPASSQTTLNPASVTSVGGSQPHNNMMPYLVLNFVIALQGIFPSRN
jgi:microcystin-dependent protein